MGYLVLGVYLASHLRSCVLHLVSISTEVITQQRRRFIGCQGNIAWLLSLHQSRSDTQYIKQFNSLRDEGISNKIVLSTLLGFLNLWTC